MKLLAVIMITSFLGGCTTMPSGQGGTFIAAPSPIDLRIELASIEDYILALPPYAFHEESVEQFTYRVRQARTTEKENVGKSPDYLFVGGDGSSPSKEFTLNRGTKTLGIRSFNWEPGMRDDSVLWQRVPGGWIRGPHIKMDTGEQP